MDYVYKTTGTCSKQSHFVIEDGVVHNVRFDGGCHGNLQGIGRLVEGMKVEDVLARLKGISCNGRATSCPDQFARALEQAVTAQK